MFFDIAWPELVLIGVVALVFIGPKDLPRALRVAGYWFGKARTLSREFQNSVDQMIREAELDEMREQLKKPPSSTSTRSFRRPSIRPASWRRASSRPTSRIISSRPPRRRRRRRANPGRYCLPPLKRLRRKQPERSRRLPPSRSNRRCRSMLADPRRHRRKRCRWQATPSR
jgi:Tat protein translocase TatB subunit